MVGGRCKLIINMEEVSSFSAQRSTSSFKEVGWRRCSGLQRIQILCDVAKGRATGVHSPSPVTRPLVMESAWPGVTLETDGLLHVDHHMAMGPLMFLDASNTFFSL